MSRIYAQLRPDEAGLAALRNVRDSLLDKQHGRPVSDDELHMTLIHFGKADDMFESLSTAAPKLDRAMYDELLNTYIRDTERRMKAGAFSLQHGGYELFGIKSSVLVARFETNHDVIAAHAELLHDLRKFVAACGVDDPNAFMSSDQNLRFAQILNPHVSLYKNFNGELPSDDLGLLRFEAMQIVY